MKHNLIWDRVLGLNLFPGSVGDDEIAWYLKVQNAYGLPVDNRTTTSLIDWAVWSIAPRGGARIFSPCWRQSSGTSTKRPRVCPCPTGSRRPTRGRKGFRPGLLWAGSSSSCLRTRAPGITGPDDRPGSTPTHDQKAAYAQRPPARARRPAAGPDELHRPHGCAPGSKTSTFASRIFPSTWAIICCAWTFSFPAA